MGAHFGHHRRDLIERLVLGLKAAEREQMAMILGVGNNQSVPRVLRQQLEMIEVGRKDPIRFCSAIKLLITRAYGQGEETVPR